MKTGFYPMKVKLKLFFEWGIKFEEAYTVKENGNRQVAYANSTYLMNKIIESYNPDFLDKIETEEKSKVRTLPKVEEKSYETKVNSTVVQQQENRGNKKSKEKQVPLRTKRPKENEVSENE